MVTKLKKLRVNIADFEMKKLIGRGHFGEVHLVKEKQTGNVYAMKVMKKEVTIAKQDVSKMMIYSILNVVYNFLCFFLFIFSNSSFFSWPSMKRKKILWRKPRQSGSHPFIALSKTMKACT